MVNRRVSVRLYRGDTYEGILRKSEMPGFLHLGGQRVAGGVVDRYIHLDDIMYFWYLVNGKKKIYEVRVVNRFRGGFLA